MKSKILLIFLLAVAYSNCTNDNLVVKPSTQSCSTPATVVDLRKLDGCGYVFVLEDGTRLEPFRVFMCGTPPVPENQQKDPLQNFEFVDGKKVFIGYEKLDSMASVCMVGPIVKITCISETEVVTQDN
jgi:hypothetical protein